MHGNREEYGGIRKFESGCRRSSSTCLRQKNLHFRYGEENSFCGVKGRKATSFYNELRVNQVEKNMSHSLKS